jgi:hypothetical protein
MSPQEMQVLQNFLAQLVQVQGVAKDPQAASLISEAISKQPDASYLLVQRALLLEQALANANSQIASLQADLREQQALNATQNPTTPTQFLDPAASNWGNSASSRPLNIPSNTGTSVTGAPLAAYPAMAAVPVSQPTPLPQRLQAVFSVIRVAACWEPSPQQPRVWLPVPFCFRASAI